MINQENLKEKVALRAMDFVHSGMRIGIGTGSTARYFIKHLGQRVREGLDIVGVPTSEETTRLAREEGITLSSLDELDELDLTVDGADEVDSELRLIKGGGGALLREKIVAFASKKMIVIADSTKKVQHLGVFPLPVEVVPFGLKATYRALSDIAKTVNPEACLTVRCDTQKKPFLTDGGHYIIDVAFCQIISPEKLADALSSLPGVVEHGLFLGIASGILLATDNGIEEIGSF